MCVRVTLALGWTCVSGCPWRQDVLCGRRCQGLVGFGGAGVMCEWGYAGWGGTRPLTVETWPLTLRSFKSLLAVSTDMVTSTLASRGQRDLPVGTVTRAGS